jgi:hypothetical protein
MSEPIFPLPNEDDITYRLRIWRSTELWDYLKLEWEEDMMPNEMTAKLLVLKQQVYAMTIAEIDEEAAANIKLMNSGTLESHHWQWSQMYIKHLADRKNEIEMEKALKAFTL